MKTIYYLFLIIFIFSIEANSTENNKDILELKKLLDAGLITSEEYEASKKIVTKKGYKEKVIESKKSIKPAIEETVKIQTVKKEPSNKIDKKARKERNELWKKDVLTSIEVEKNDPYCKIVTKKTKEDKMLNYCLKKSDILKLGYYERLKFPKFILDEVGGCKTNSCVRKRAGLNVYKFFVQRTQKYHTKYPGDMIKGMAWFEILYIDNLKKNQKVIKKYLNNKNELKVSEKRKIHSIIKMNNGRIKMREALGFTLYDDFYDVVESQWVLGNFLNKDKLKVTKVKLSPEMLKRKELIDRYKLVLKKYKDKLEEEREKQNKKNAKKS